MISGIFVSGILPAFNNRFWKHHHCYNFDGWRGLFEEYGWSIARHQTFDPTSARLWQDSFIPLSIGSFMSRKFFGRWFAVPVLRRMYALFISIILGRMMNRYLFVQDNGGLFFELRKRA